MEALRHLMGSIGVMSVLHAYEECRYEVSVLRSTQNPPGQVKLEEDGENMSPAFRLWATVSSLVFRYLIGSASHIIMRYVHMRGP